MNFTPHSFIWRYVVFIFFVLSNTAILVGDAPSVYFDFNFEVCPINIGISTSLGREKQVVYVVLVKACKTLIAF